MSVSSVGKALVYNNSIRRANPKTEDWTEPLTNGLSGLTQILVDKFKPKPAHALFDTPEETTPLEAGTTPAPVV